MSPRGAGPAAGNGPHFPNMSQQQIQQQARMYTQGGQQGGRVCMCCLPAPNVTTLCFFAQPSVLTVVFSWCVFNRADSSTLKVRAKAADVVACNNNKAEEEVPHRQRTCPLHSQMYVHFSTLLLLFFKHT